MTKFQWSDPFLLEEQLSLEEKMIMKTPGFFSIDTLTSKKYIINQNIMLNRTTYIDRNNFGFIVKINKIEEN